MTTCAQGHEPIQHDEFHCPLCAALEDSYEFEGEIERLKTEAKSANTTIALLKEQRDNTMRQMADLRKRYAA